MSVWNGTNGHNSKKNAPLSFTKRTKKRKKPSKKPSKVLKETIPYYLTRLDAIVQKNKGHLALGRLTWIDLYFACSVPNYTSFARNDILSKYPNLKTLQNKVYAISVIKSWIETCPKTEF
ncbi:GST C domain containing protein [Asbolus verrucosus]|uniref:GST C domain containing protein n=1 Tax=Asbolus verrucosus TaxID=1661398 RepID=A0A482VEE6_ASBVE|nr:GST C domain containing protein [Asbolus verrucosus]